MLKINKKPPAITISNAVHGKVMAFKEVVEAAIEDKMELNDCVELILEKGIDAMLLGLVGNVEADTLLRAIQQLGSKYPAQVYSHIAETIRRGSEINREEMKKSIGF